MKEWLMKLGLIESNYRGNDIPTGVGVFFIPPLLLFWIIYLVFNLGNYLILVRLIYLITIVSGVSFIDDLTGEKKYQGFKGHFSQLIRGNLTSGALKAIIILLAAVMVLDWTGSWFLRLTDLGIIVLMTNFLNLLDLRPGRSFKFFLLTSLVLVLLLPSYLIYIFPLYLLSLIYLPFELNGRVMLGDTGANLLGVILGYGFSSTRASLTGKILLFIFLLALTLLSERYSFSKIIKDNKFLNWLDMLGRNEN